MRSSRNPWRDREASVARRMSIRSQVAIALVVVGSSLVAAIAVNLYQVRETRRITGLNLELRAPALIACRALLGGVQRAQAELAAQLVRPDPARARARATAWLEEVEPALARLEVLSGRGAAALDAARIQELRSLATGLRTAQEEIEQGRGGPQAGLE